MDAAGKIIARSGLSEELFEMDVKPDFDFREILRALQKIHKGKSILYGNYMETHGDENDKLSIIQHYCDIKRKWVRIDNFVKALLEDNEAIPLEELLDTYSDMAVYSALGIQLVSHLMDRKDAKAESMRKIRG